MERTEHSRLTESAARGCVRRLVSWLVAMVIMSRCLLTLYFLWNAAWCGLFWPLMWRDCLWNLAVAIAICPAWDEAS